MLIAGGAGQVLLQDGWTPPARAIRLLFLSLICGLLGYLLLSVGWLHLADLPVLGALFADASSARIEMLVVSGVAALLPVMVAWWGARS
jgi:hypothetical protein